MPECGAKARSGEPCRNRAMENGRCRLHGGKSTGAPKGSQNARTHGIYAKALVGEEIDLWNQVTLGSLDDDIRIAKIQLRRALLAQNKADHGGDGLDLDLISINESGGGYDEETGEDKPPRKTVTTQRRRRGFEDIINRLLGRIADMEAKRIEMLNKSASSGNKDAVALLAAIADELPD